MHRAVAVGGLALIAFLPTLACGFVTLDDDVYVFRNPAVLGGLTPANVAWALHSVVAANWAPLTILSYQLDATVFGPGPWGFHLTNLLLHAAAAGLLCLALERMTERPGAALAVAALWAVHPLRVESVTWISERKDVLSMLALAGVLVVYERFCRRPTVAGMALVTAVATAGLLCKASLVTLPVLLLILDAWPLGRALENGRYPRRSWAALVVEKLPLGVVCGCFVAVTLASQTGAMSPVDRLPLWSVRVPNALHAAVWYVRATIWPVALHPLRLQRGASYSAGYVAACLGLLGAAAALAWRGRASRPAIAAGLAWYLVALLPMIGLIQVGLQGTADRYSLIPQVGLLVALVWTAIDAGGASLASRFGPWMVGGLVLLAGLVDVGQIGVWRDGETLWNHVLAHEPDNFVAHDHLGNLWHQRRHFENARDHYLAALRASPDRPRFIANLAWLYNDVGDTERARAYRDEAVRVGPRDPDVRRMVEHLRATAPEVPEPR